MTSFKHLLLSAIVLLGATITTRAAVETYKIDPAHSSAGFTIRHLVSKVPGSFSDVEGLITVDRDHLENSTVTATIKVASVDTGNAKRDQHLATPDFFDTARFPSITFKSTSWKKTGDNTFDVAGDLTIKDVTRPVVLKVGLLGFGTGMRGAPVSGWEATTTLDKSAFGVDGPAMLGNVLGNEVTVTITIEAGLAP